MKVSGNEKKCLEITVKEMNGNERKVNLHFSRWKPALSANKPPFSISESPLIPHSFDPSLLWPLTRYPSSESFVSQLTCYSIDPLLHGPWYSFTHLYSIRPLLHRPFALLTFTLFRLYLAYPLLYFMILSLLLSMISNGTWHGILDFKTSWVR